MTVQEAAKALHVDCDFGNVWFTGVSTDSRSVQPGDLFIALSGEKFDGRAFILHAAGNGAVAAVVKQHPGNSGLATKLPLIQVKDTLLALGQLAAYWRGKFTLPLIAITGSNGKTTVKEMVAAILRKQVETNLVGNDCTRDTVLATEGNLNNEIGVPQTLLRLRAQHAYAVIEMGMNHAGEIDYLTRLAKPNIAVITNAGAAHVEGLGSIAAVACAKGEIFVGLKQQGIAVINRDDQYAALWCQLVQSKKVIDFGLDENAQVSANCQGGSLVNQITLKLPNGMEESVTLQVPGKHNVMNALAAAAVAVGLNINKQVIVSGLASFTGVKGRMQKKNGLCQSTIIDDSYNANPASVQAALDVLTATPGKRILVLGDMGELGESAADFHRNIGKQASLAGLDQLFTFGELSTNASAGFGVAAKHFQSMGDLIAEIKCNLASDTTVLIKGSRFMQMEQVVRQLEVIN